AAGDDTFAVGRNRHGGNGLGVAAEGAYFFPLRHVPQLDEVIVAAGDGLLAVAGEGDRSHRALVPAPGPQLLAAGGFPEGERIHAAARNDLLALFRKDDRCSRPLDVRRLLPQLLAAVRVPEGDGTFPGHAPEGVHKGDPQNVLAVRREGDAAQPLFRSLSESVQFLPRVNVPEFHRIVRRRGDRAFAVGRDGHRVNVRSLDTDRADILALQDIPPRRRPVGPAERACLPSGENTAASTAFLCFWRVKRFLPPTTSHTFTVWSLLADRARLPSGEKAQAMMPELPCPLS